MPAYSGPVFNFEHNWNEPVVERIAFLTSVLRKRDGSEQRIRLRQKPRRTIEYKALIGGVDFINERQRFDALLWSTQDLEIMVPIWADAVALTAQLNSGSGSVTVPAIEGYDYGADAGYLIFWQSPTSYEVMQIASFNSGTGVITFETNTTLTWAKGTRVMPAWVGVQDPIASDDVYASDIKSTAVKFEIKVPQIAPSAYVRAVAPTLDTYRSVDVWDSAGMDGSNQRQLERTMQRVDFGVGQFHYDSIQAAPFGGIDCNLEMSGRSEIKAFLGWINMRVGRQKAFWFPTWEQDFEFIELIGADTFTAEKFGYADTYNLTESRRDVAIINNDGTREYRRITAVSENISDDLFALDDDFPAGTLDRISFLRYCRLDQDELELAWNTTDDLTVSMKFRELIKTA